MTRLAPVLALALMGAWACRAPVTASKAARADREDRPRVVMASADWCGPCKEFKRLVLPHPRVQRALQSVEWVVLHDGADDRRLAQLGVNAFPTFVVVDGKGQAVARLQGASGVEAFVDFLSWSAPRAFDPARLRALQAASTSAFSDLLAARWFALRGEAERAANFYEQALRGFGDGQRARSSELEWERRLVASWGQPIAALEERALELLHIAPDASNVLQPARIVFLSPALSLEQKSGAASVLLEASAERPALLNRLVYVFLAAEMNERALQAAVMQVKHSPVDANARDSLAEVYHYRGDKGAAISSSAEALKFAKGRRDRRGYSKNLQRFEAEGFLPSRDVADVHRRYQRFLRRYGIQP